MSNCHDLFSDFNETISLSKSRKKSLKISRKSIRNRIREYFKINLTKETIPKFNSQGSFEMGTGINPIGRKETVNGEEKTFYKYDVDDGIYFIEDLNIRKSIQTYHNWIYNSVDGYTDEDPIDKNTCVRVLFHDGHNIDLPIYFKDKDKSDSIPELAHKKKNWINSDPLAFIKWFNENLETNPELCRLVKYLKAWCDYQNFISNSNKMPTGIIMTIWAAEKGAFTADRDDLTLRDTLQALSDAINYENTYVCKRPTEPVGEDLIKNYSYKGFFKEKLNEFLVSAKQACDESNQKEACLKWQKHLGPRFPCHLAEDKDENAAIASAPHIITNNAKGA